MSSQSRQIFGLGEIISRSGIQFFHVLNGEGRNYPLVCLPCGANKQLLTRCFLTLFKCPCHYSWHQLHGYVHLLLLSTGVTAWHQGVNQERATAGCAFKLDRAYIKMAHPNHHCRFCRRLTRKANSLTSLLVQHRRANKKRTSTAETSKGSF